MGACVDALDDVEETAIRQVGTRGARRLRWREGDIAPEGDVDHEAHIGWIEIGVGGIAEVAIARMTGSSDHDVEGLGDPH